MAFGLASLGLGYGLLRLPTRDDLAELSEIVLVGLFLLAVYGVGYSRGAWNTRQQIQSEEHQRKLEAG